MKRNSFFPNALFALSFSFLVSCNNSTKNASAKKAEEQERQRRELLEVARKEAQLYLDQYGTVENHDYEKSTVDEKDFEESVDGVYSYAEPNFEAVITISGSSWSGRTTLYGRTEYDRGIVRGNDLYEESGYSKIGYVGKERVVTSLGGKRLTMKKK